MGISKEEVKEIVWEVLREMPKFALAIGIIILSLRACLPEA